MAAFGVCGFCTVSSSGPHVRRLSGLRLLIVAVIDELSHSDLKLQSPDTEAARCAHI